MPGELKQDSRNQLCWYKDVCEKVSCNSCIRYNEMKFLVDSSGIPYNKQYPQELIAGVDIAAFEELAAIKDDIVEFVANGENLYICSQNTGNGKTSWSIKLLLKYFDQIWAGNGFRVRGLFIHVPTLLNNLKNFSNPLSEEYKKDIIQCDLVVWDDIGSSYLSDYDNSQLISLIDQRIFNEKSNIYTGNLVDKDLLLKSLGDRLYSRVINSSEVVIFRGKDRRGYGSITDNK